MFKKLVLFVRDPAIRRTFGYYSLFICLGLSTAITGPTLPSLAEQTRSDLGRMGGVFLALSIGYTLGTLFGGRVIDRARGHPVLGFAQLSAAVLIFFIPTIPWFWLLVALLVCKGFAEGFINTGANTLLIWTHRDKVSPFMNGLHFFFGFGAFLAPLLIAQVTGFASGYRWAYQTLAAVAALAGLGMFLLPGSPRPPEHSSEKSARTPSNARSYYPLVLIAALFLFFYVGAEITFGGWVYTYALTMKLTSAAGAAYLTSGFWFSFTIGRLVSIPAATRFKPSQVIPVALTACLLILASGMLFPASPGILWMMAIGLGFCMAPVWPTGFTLAGQSIPLSGKLSGLVLLGDSFGGMVLPWLVGQVIDSAGPQAMLYLIFASLILNFASFAGLLRFRKSAASVAVEKG